MPVTFTNERVIDFAAIIGFREKGKEEKMEDYRKEVARFHSSNDPVEAHEIRTGKGWNVWSDEEFDDLVSRHPMLAQTNMMVMSRMMHK